MTLGKSLHACSGLHEDRALNQYDSFSQKMTIPEWHWGSLGTGHLLFGSLWRQEL